MHQLDQYKLAFDITPMPMLLVSKAGEIILSNRLFDDLFEYEPSLLAGRHVEVLIPEANRTHHPELRERYFSRPVKRVMGQGRELSGVTQSGRIFPLELSLDTVLIDQTEYALLVAIDIEPRKQHEQYLKITMDAAASAMVVVNDKGVIVFVNKAATALFGYEQHALLGSPVEKLVPLESQSVHRHYTDRFVKTSEARSMGAGLELYALHRQGHNIPVEIELTPVDMLGGKMVVSTIIDLSERVRAQKVISEKNDELASVNAELQQFAFSASHDLKAPISTMVGLLNLCVEDLDGGNLDELRQNLGHVQQIGLRSAKKVESVLEIARVGKAHLQPELIDIERVIDDIWLDLMGASNGEIQLKLDLQHVNPVVLEPDTLKLILENLLSNAVRYSDERKLQQIIEIKTQCIDGTLMVSVIDNGMGIPEHAHDAVFEMFKLIDTRSHSGLGLNLVKKQIDRLHGSLDFESTFGEGTMFRFSLPLLNQ